MYVVASFAAHYSEQDKCMLCVLYNLQGGQYQDLTLAAPKYRQQKELVKLFG
jgi:hypothetical protein